MRKKNCWEIKLCGRQPGGINEKDVGICSVALESKFNAINSGVNGGRYCWNVADTLCEYHHFGTFSSNNMICDNCEVQNLIKAEEGSSFIE